MKYWDASAVVPLLVAEASSASIQGVVQDDPAMVTWWGTSLECFSMLHRLRRADELSPPDFLHVKQSLELLFAEIDIIAPSQALKDRALRSLAVHPLRAADALQLAAALIWCQDHTRDVDFVTLDNRLREAAIAEGFRVLPA